MESTSSSPLRQGSHQVVERNRYGGVGGITQLHLVGSRQSSADEFPRLADAMSKNDSLFRNLERDYQAELAYADEEVDATAANDRTAELLGVLHGSPLLRIRQVIFSTSNKPVVYVVGIYRSERHSLFIRRFR